jgi:hypothetical protein
MCAHRLLIVGPARTLQRFARSKWDAQAHAQHIDILECSETRLSFQFESGGPPLAYLRKASGQWRSLTFLLDYEIEKTCLKGLAKARRGELETCLMSYA